MLILFMNCNSVYLSVVVMVAMVDNDVQAQHLFGNFNKGYWDQGSVSQVDLAVAYLSDHQQHTDKTIIYCRFNVMVNLFNYARNTTSNNKKGKYVHTEDVSLARGIYCANVQNTRRTYSHQ